MDISILAATAIALGMRHGLDWDHIAAITDLVSTTFNTIPVNHQLLSGAYAELPLDSVCKQTFGAPLRVSSLYAVGHAAVVSCLGIIAISFSACIPQWVNPIMNKMVAATLIIFGLYLLFAVGKFLLRGGELRLKSRWMLVLESATKLREHQATTGGCGHKLPERGCCGPRSALAIGMIHGFGAETGTQVLLISAVSGAKDPLISTFLLGCFTAGMFASNTMVAALVSFGARYARLTASLTVAAGLLTAIFSISVGASLLLGGAL